MFLSANGKDRNGLQLENVGASFSSYIAVFYKIPLKYLWFALALIIHLITNPRCERSILGIKKGDVFSPFNQILRFDQ